MNFIKRRVKVNNVLITGANSGIGLAITKAFLNLGYRVFAHYNSKKNELEKLKSNNIVLLQADLSNTNNTEKLFESILKECDTLDVLVNNAGLYKPANSFEEITLDVFEDTLNVNLKAPFTLSQKYIALMKNKKKGRIVNISSIGVKYGGHPATLPYTISKSALETMTVSLAKEGAKYNILINTLRVGVTDTDIHKQNRNKNMEARVNMIPLKRMANPEEIADYVIFLSSEHSNFITGSINTIAGGE
jgi:NAD(P)-dependent dehydrogenase (short-subunit alcohol dehydrogenase family)